MRGLLTRVPAAASRWLPRTTLATPTLRKICYPFFGLQIFLSVGVASVVRGNHLLAAAGTLVSNPLTYLPLYWFNYLVGCRLLGPGQGGINLAELNRSSLWAQGWEFSQRILLGSTVVGMVLALVSGWMAHQIFQREVEGYSSKGRNTNSNQTNNY